MNAALPGIASRFDLTSTSLQWTMTAYTVTFAGFLLFGGRLADVLGRRSIFIVVIGLFALAAAARALAPTSEVLVVARGAQGMGAALSVPAAIGLLGEVFPEGAARNRALGIYTAVAAASGSGGFVLGGVLTDALGWRSVLALASTAGLAVLILARRALPVGARRQHPIDIPGAVTVTFCFDRPRLRPGERRRYRLAGPCRSELRGSVDPDAGRFPELGAAYVGSVAAAGGRSAAGSAPRCVDGLVAGTSSAACCSSLRCTCRTSWPIPRHARGSR